MPVPAAELKGLGRKMLVKGWLSKPPEGLREEVFQLASDEVRWLVANRWPNDTGSRGNRSNGGNRLADSAATGRPGDK